MGDHQTNINEKEMTSQQGQQAVSHSQSLDYCTTELHNYLSNEHVLCPFCDNQISEYKSLGSTTCCSKSVLEIIDGKYVCINYAGCPQGRPCLGLGRVSFFFFVVLTNLHINLCIKLCPLLVGMYCSDCLQQKRPNQNLLLKHIS